MEKAPIMMPISDCKNFEPKAMQIAAPNAADEEIPKVNGLTR